MKRTVAFLGAGLVGVVSLLVGLAVDSYLHAKDPTLAHREGLFTLSNPGHVLLGIGIGLVVVGMVGAAYTTLPYGVWVRRGLLGGALLLVVASGDIAGWAASQQFSQASLTTSAAGGHDHNGTQQATPAQIEAAAKLIYETRKAVARYSTLKAAIAAGYVPMEPPNTEVLHYVNRSYMVDADILDPQHVQSLIYYNDGHDAPELIGAMYILPRRGMDGPQIGGPLTQWHQHSNICFDDVTGMAVAFVHQGDDAFENRDKSGACPRGSTNKTTPLMLHVWLIDNPEGPFASTMAPQVLGTTSAIS